MPLSNSNKSRDLNWLARGDIAHRGLHDGTPEAPENSLSAIKRAIDAGYAIEIDVRITRDEQIVIFHDKDLKRLCDRDELVENQTLNQLKAVNILGGDQTIPSLSDGLALVDGKVPVYIEIKSERDKDMSRLCAGVRRALEGYRSPLAVMSFDPRVVKWFRENSSDICRGLVVDAEGVKPWHTPLTVPFLLKKIKPDFMAFDVNILPNKIATKWRAKGGKLLTWTVKTKEQVVTGRAHADAMIFERK